MKGPCIAGVLLCVAAGAMAQVHPVRPTDRIYQDLDRWEALGYLPAGYVLRPYSPEVLRAALEHVLSHAHGADRMAAERYLRLLGEPRFSPTVLTRAALRASSDQSHFHSQQRAELLDGAVIKALKAQDIDQLYRLDAEGRGEACGLGPMATVILTCQALGEAELQVCDHRTSAAATGDESSVVGYTSAILTLKP